MKVLVVRFSSIGDIVLCSPVVRSLKEAGCLVHFLTKKSFANIVEPNPNVDQLHVYDGKWKVLVSDLKKEKFDLIVDLHKNLRTFRLGFDLKVKRFTFPKLNFRKWLKVNFKKTSLPDIHIVDRYYMAVEHLGIINDNKGLDYFFPANFVFTAKKFLDFDFKNGNYIVWVLGGAHKTKCFPEDRIVDFLNGVEGKVILIGGPSEQNMGERIANKLSNDVVNSAGKTSLHESSKLIEYADKVVTNDTGMMHIAAAFGKEIISLWGNTIPEFGMTAYEPKSPHNVTNLQVVGLPCRPCSKIGYDKCPRGHFNCMNLISKENVINALKQSSTP